MARNPKKLYMDTNTPMAMNAVATSPTRRGLRRWPATARTSAPGRIDAFGRKLRCSGSRMAVATARARLTAALVASAQRQSVTSSMNAGMRRPVSPPTEVPAM